MQIRSPKPRNKNRLTVRGQMESLESRLCFAAFPISHAVSGSQKIDAASVSVADINGDTRPDLVVAGFSNNKVSYYENLDGMGSFGPEKPISRANESLKGAVSVVAADINGDGHQDVVAGGRDSQEIVWYENVKLGISTEFSRHSIAAQVGLVNSVQTADMDADGKLDVLAASDDGVFWFRNQGRGQFAAASNFVWSYSYRELVARAADFDGDGDMDVVTTTNWYSDLNWIENKSGNGRTWVDHSIRSIGYGSRDAFPADVDGDKDIDIISTIDDSIVWNENLNGKGNFRKEHRLITDQAEGAQSVYPADIDRDGDVDIAFAAWVNNSSTPDVVHLGWLENTGGGQDFQLQTVSRSISSPYRVFVADIDTQLNAGRPDLIVAVSQGVNWYENRDIGDSNNDGKFDSSDLVVVFQAGEYEDSTEDNSTFSDGDWNGDGDFNSGDLVHAFSNGDYADRAFAKRTLRRLFKPNDVDAAWRRRVARWAGDPVGGGLLDDLRIRDAALQSFLDDNCSSLKR